MSDLEDKARAALEAKWPIEKYDVVGIEAIMEALAPIFAEVDARIEDVARTRDQLTRLLEGLETERARDSARVASGLLGLRVREPEAEPAGDVVAVDLEALEAAWWAGHTRGQARVAHTGQGTTGEQCSADLDDLTTNESWDAERKRRLAMYNVPPMSHAELHAPIEGPRAPDPIAALTARVDRMGAALHAAVKSMEQTDDVVDALEEEAKSHQHRLSGGEMVPGVIYEMTSKPVIIKDE